METFLELSYEYVNVFSVFRSIPSGTIDINLRSCALNRHKLQQSKIATIQESLPLQFVICRNLWSRPWRHKLSPITLKTYSGYMGINMKSFIFADSGVISLVHLFVCIWLIMILNDVPRKLSFTHFTHFYPFWCYFTGISVCVYVYQL